MKSIYINNTDLGRDKRFTYLASDVSAGGTILVLQSLIGFQNLSTSSGQILLLGEIGSEKSEIIRTSTQYGLPVGAGIANTITLGAIGLTFDHPQDTKVTIVDWDRAEVQWAATASGSKSTILAYPVPIQADLREMLVNDNTKTSGYYFVRFNETIGNTNSDWSDPVPFGDYDDNTVFKIKKRALDQCNETIDGSLLTHELLNQWLWEARREYHQSPGKRPFRMVNNANIGTITAGMYRAVLPNTVENPYTAENVYGIRIGKSLNLNYYDKKEWDFDYTNKPHGILQTAYAIGARDLYLDNVDDFTSTGGSVSIENDTISYSAIGTSGGTLRISADGTTSHASGADVWQNVYLGLPDKYTVFADPAGSAYVYFNRPLGTAYVNQNIYADYYRTLVGYDSDADILDEPHYDMFVDYLAYKIKQRKARGAIPVGRTKTGQVFIADSDFQAWNNKKNEQLAQEYLGKQIRFSPDVDSLDFTRRW